MLVQSAASLEQLLLQKTGGRPLSVQAISTGTHTDMGVGRFGWLEATPLASSGICTAMPLTGLPWMLRKNFLYTTLPKEFITGRRESAQVKGGFRLAAG
jgi:hypothetical protein